MSAYVIYHQTEIRDSDGYREKYLAQARASIVQYGGRHIAGGDGYEVLEGDWQGPRVIIHEFPDMDCLMRWYNSEEFKPLKKFRQSISEGNLIVVEGVPA